MIMSRQHTALLLRENANEADSSAISHQKRNPFVSKLIVFQNGRSWIRYRQEIGAAEIWGVSVHELNVIIVESHFDPYKFREYFIWKHSEKNTNRRRKANFFLENDSPFILNVEIGFLLYCIRSVLPITPIYAYKYTHVIWSHAFNLFFFFFCVYME